METTVAATLDKEIRRKIHELSRVERAFATLERARRDIRNIDISMYALHHAGLSQSDATDLRNRLATMEDDITRAANAAADNAATVKQSLMTLVAQIGE